jgi:DNA-binding CsgD family transcriptional regulator
LLEKVLGMSVAEARERYERLTERQRQVAELMSQGMTNRRIAEEMGISPKTLDIHRADVFDKLECKTSAAVAAIVYLVNLAAAVLPNS